MMNVQTSAVITVGDGRGFVVEARPRTFPFTGRKPLVVTAAHCLPRQPPAHAASYLYERTYGNLLGALGEKPHVWAECLFADPVADIAVLGEPDNQELDEQADAYQELTEAAGALPIGAAPEKTISSLPDPRGDQDEFRDAVSKLGEPVTIPAWVLSLDQEWLAVAVRYWCGPLILVSDSTVVVGGMSGSPIVDSAGFAIGALSTGNGPNPRLTYDLPGWLLAGFDGSH
jgi:hypothetical protein